MKQDWENIYYYGMGGGMALGAVLIYYKPDTRSVPLLPIGWVRVGPDQTRAREDPWLIFFGDLQSRGVGEEGGRGSHGQQGRDGACCHPLEAAWADLISVPAAVVRQVMSGNGRMDAVDSGHPAPLGCNCWRSSKPLGALATLLREGHAAEGADTEF